MKGRLILGLVITLLMIVPVFAQAPINVQNQSIDSEFRDHITAKLSAQSSTEITKIEFFYKVVGQVATTRDEADFNVGTSVEASFSIDQTSIYFPPGTTIEYWWKLTDANGDTFKTERQTYLYVDNRHDFKTLSNDRVAVYWYRGGDNFGQALFDQANVALDRLEKNVGVSVNNAVNIFVYGSHQDLLDAIAVGAQEWTGGQAFPEYGSVVIGITPDNLDWGLKATTHELTHLVVHQATDNPYGDLPRWLDEGLAVYNEDPDNLDFQFRGSFNDAVKNDNLMTLQTLSSSFPADSDLANLAYGESGAVVKFIIDTYGTDAMTNLLAIFSEGELYDKALMQALGVDTHGLDNQWRASLNLPPLPDTQSTAPTAEAPASAVPKPTATIAGALVDESASSSRGLPCVSGVAPLAVLGMMVLARRKETASR